MKMIPANPAIGNQRNNGPEMLAMPIITLSVSNELGAESQ
jgi:hypothetical protein